jgi:hypothetical protein
MVGTIDEIDLPARVYKRLGSWPTANNSQDQLILRSSSGIRALVVVVIVYPPHELLYFITWIEATSNSRCLVYVLLDRE